MNHPTSDPTGSNEADEFSEFIKVAQRRARLFAVKTVSFYIALFSLAGLGALIALPVLPDLLAIALSIIGFASVLLYGITVDQLPAALEQSYADSIEAADRLAVENPQPGKGLIDDILDAYRDDERAMQNARRAADRSSGMGQILLILGLLIIPGSVFWIYSWPPRHPEVIETALEQLVTTQPEWSIEVAALYQGDWHILLASGSMGFLFLATGAGLLRESRHKMNIYFRLARRVAVIKSYLLAVQLARRLEAGDAPETGPLRETATAVIKQLLESGVDDHTDLTEGKDTSAEVLKAVVGKLPSAKG